MKLYNYWRSSSSYRVRIALHLKELPFEYMVVNLLTDEQKTPEHRARSPLGTVPVLELDDGRRLTESLAIIQYLDEVKDTPPLLPRDPYLRARARMLAELVNAGIQPLQNMAVGKYVKELGGDDKAWTRHWIARGLAGLEAAVQDTAGRFSVGDEVSLADCTLVPQLTHARRFQVDLAGCPTLLRIEAACLDLPGFQRAAPEVQPDAPRTE
jgi:maleylpyruvate isomerase